MVGRIGLGWEGVSDVPVFFSGASQVVRVSAPAIGIRWWLSPRLGLDIGVGVGYRRASEGGDSLGSTTALLLRAGVPYAVYVGRHFTFVAQAHVVVGHARATATTRVFNGNQQITVRNLLKGYRIDFSCQGGAEIHFGFIGVPELSLQGSVGLFMQHEWVDGNSSAGTADFNQTVLTTTSVSDPWDFFRTSLAARYYF